VGREFKKRVWTAHVISEKLKWKIEKKREGDSPFSIDQFSMIKTWII
jgi:hypothetical protein